MAVILQVNEVNVPDRSGGGNDGISCLRSHAQAWFESQNRSRGIEADASETIPIIDNQAVRPDDQIAVKRLTPYAVVIHVIGVGCGISDRLKEMGSGVQGLSVGERPQDETKFTNLKAETYWNARSWVLAGGKLKRDDRFLQLAWIKDKVTTDKVIQIEPKVSLQ
jgi:hypothetical protein